MNKGGSGKGWAKGPYDRQNRQMGGSEWSWYDKYDKDDAYGKSSSDDPNMTPVASNLTNLMGDQDAFGKRPSLGSALSKMYNSQQWSDTSNAGEPATQDYDATSTNNSCTDAINQSSKKVVHSMSPKVIPVQKSSSQSASASSGHPSAAMATTDATPEHHNAPKKQLLLSRVFGDDVDNSSDDDMTWSIFDKGGTDDTGGAHTEWNASVQLVEDGITKEEYIAAKRFGQELASDNEDEQDKKEQAEYDELLNQGAQWSSGG